VRAVEIRGKLVNGYLPTRAAARLSTGITAAKGLAALPARARRWPH